jgi:aspartyl protease family protein
MGITTITAKVLNPADRTRSANVQFIVDSGAAYSVVPASVLEQIGVEAEATKEFFLANGDSVERRMGIAVFEYLGRLTAASVLFGEEDDAPLMGVTTLEGFGFVLDPFKRELRPMLMRL